MIRVRLSANDALSGVGATYYRVDGGSQQTYAGGIVIAAQGVHTVEYWSVDRAGNSEVRPAQKAMDRSSGAKRKLFCPASSNRSACQNVRPDWPLSALSDGSNK